jgi:type IV pilus assembly protein PilW
MKNSFHPPQRGFSLIELLVGVAVSLVLMAIASSIFVGSVRSNRVQEERSKQNETAQLVIELLARDLKNAGTYPAANPEIGQGGAKPPSAFSSAPQGNYNGIAEGKIMMEMPNIVNPAWPAFDTGIYACSKAGFDRTTGQCLTAGASTAPDTLIINYFSDDTFPQTAGSFPGPGSGTRVNCLNQSVDGLTHNQARVTGGDSTSASPSKTVIAPVMVTNIYGLGAAQTYEGNAGSITTRSFGCHPLGQTLFQPFFQGVEQMRLRFGLYDASTLMQNPTTSIQATTKVTPARFYTVEEMNALIPVLINGETLTPWKRVVAVEVCIVTRSLEYNAREAQANTVINDCDGQPIQAIANQPRPIIAVTRQVFTTRNAVKATL